MNSSSFSCPVSHVFPSEMCQKMKAVGSSDDILHTDMLLLSLEHEDHMMLSGLTDQHINNWLIYNVCFCSHGSAHTQTLCNREKQPSRKTNSPITLHLSEDKSPQSFSPNERLLFCSLTDAWEQKQSFRGTSWGHVMERPMIAARHQHHKLHRTLSCLLDEKCSQIVSDHLRNQGPSW